MAVSPIARTYLFTRSHALMAALAAMLFAGAAWGQSFDPSALANQDRQAIQTLLEEEHTNVPRTLPVSQDIFTITRTETQPRICRHFVIQTQAGAQRQGVGCRVAALNWELAPSLNAIANAPSIPSGGSAATAPSLSSGPQVDVRPAPSESASQSGASAIAGLPITPFLEIEPTPLPVRRPGAETPTTAGGTQAGEDATTIAEALAAGTEPDVQDRPDATVESDAAAADPVAAAPPFTVVLPARRPTGLAAGAFSRPAAPPAAADQPSDGAAQGDAAGGTLAPPQLNTSPAGQAPITGNPAAQPQRPDLTEAAGDGEPAQATQASAPPPLAGVPLPARRPAR